jgi:hypothetical protein
MHARRDRAFVKRKNIYSTKQTSDRVLYWAREFEDVQALLARKSFLGRDASVGMDGASVYVF